MGDDRPVRILSLGAGVQSTTLALMAAFGDIEPIEHAIFADTGWEPEAVYTHLEELTGFLEQMGVNVHKVAKGNIRTDHVAPTDPALFIRKPVKYPEMKGKQRTFIPFFVEQGNGGRVRGVGDLGDLTLEDAQKVKRGITRRTCTMTYKIEPVEKKIREILGLKKNQRWPLEHQVDELLGISTDESQRMRDSKRPAIRFLYPLIDLGMSRDDCHAKMAEYGWTAPRSACLGCPFHSNEEWRNIRDNDPVGWADVVEADEVLRQRSRDGLLATRGTPYLHHSYVPLADADLGSLSPTGLDEECEGFCGT